MRDICPVDLLSSVGRVLVEPVLADRDFPPFRRAARDGYAVQAADLRQIPTKLQVVGRSESGIGKHNRCWCGSGCLHHDGGGSAGGQ